MINNLNLVVKWRMKHNEEKNSWREKEKKKKPRKTLLKKHLIPFLELAEIEYKVFYFI